MNYFIYSKFGTSSKCNDIKCVRHTAHCTNAQMQHMKFTKTPNKPKLKQTNVNEWVKQ